RIWRHIIIFATIVASSCPQRPVVSQIFQLASNPTTYVSDGSNCALNGDYLTGRWVWKQLVCVLIHAFLHKLHNSCFVVSVPIKEYVRNNQKVWCNITIIILEIVQYVPLLQSVSSYY
ncbi:ribonuclease HIII, partial [Striga asiatica]